MHSNPRLEDRNIAIRNSILPIIKIFKSNGRKFMAIRTMANFRGNRVPFGECTM